MAEGYQASAGNRVEICKLKTFDNEKSEVTLKLLLASGVQPTASLVKVKLAEALKLRVGSVMLFGVFLGPLGNPRELLLDSYPVPENCQELCFQRLSFDKDEEIRITKSDTRALRLIFWEAVNAYKRGKILPKLDPVTIDALEKHLLQTTSTSPPPVQAMLGFMSIIHSIPYYFWSLYYRANYCVLQCPITLKDQEILEGTEVHLAMSIEELMFLDCSGKAEVASWFWDEIHLIRLQKSSQHFITFEVVNEDKDLGKDVFDSVSVATDQSEYLYSVAVHILKVLEERLLSRKNLDPALGQGQEIINTGFRKKMLPAKPRADAYPFQGIPEELDTIS